MIGEGIGVEIVGFLLAVVAEGESVSVLEEVVADVGAGKVGIGVVVIQGMESAALPVGAKSPFREKTCPCVVVRCFCIKKFVSFMNYCEHEKLHQNRTSIHRTSVGRGARGEGGVHWRARHTLV